MGNGTSSLYLDTSWVNQIDGEWRSARARELDKLGGEIPIAGMLLFALIYMCVHLCLFVVDWSRCRARCNQAGKKHAISFGLSEGQGLCGDRS